MPRQYEEISGAMCRPNKIKISVTFHEVDATQDHQQLFDPQSKSTGQQTLKAQCSFLRRCFPQAVELCAL